MQCSSLSSASCDSAARRTLRTPGPGAPPGSGPPRRHAEADARRGAAHPAAGQPHLRRHLPVPADGGAQLRGARVPVGGGVHALAARLQLGRGRDARHVHDDARREPRVVRLGHVRGVVPEQVLGRLHPDPRVAAAQRLQPALPQLLAHGQQDVLRHRPGERQEEPLHRGRVQEPDGHLQLHHGHLHQHHGRLQVRVHGDGPAAQVLRAAREDHLHRDGRAAELPPRHVRADTHAVQLRPALRRHPHPQQEHHPAQRRQGVPVAVPARRRQRDRGGGVELAAGQHPHGLLPHHHQHVPRRGGHRLHQRDAAGQERAHGPHQLHVLVAPERVEPGAAGREPAGGAARAGPGHRQRQQAAHQPGGLRQHAARRVPRVPARLRQGRHGPQRPRALPLLLRGLEHGHGGGAVRPERHLPRVPGGLAAAVRPLHRVLPDAAAVPAHRRGRRRRQDALQVLRRHHRGHQQGRLAERAGHGRGDRPHGPLRSLTHSPLGGEPGAPAA